MKPGEFKELCKEAWKQKESSLQNNRLDIEEKKIVCNESRNEDEVIKPLTDPFCISQLFAKLSVGKWSSLIFHIQKVFQLMLLFRHL